MYHSHDIELTDSKEPEDLYANAALGVVITLTTLGFFAAAVAVSTIVVYNISMGDMPLLGIPVAVIALTFLFFVFNFSRRCLASLRHAFNKLRIARRTIA